VRQSFNNKDDAEVSECQPRIGPHAIGGDEGKCSQRVTGYAKILTSGKTAMSGQTRKEV
jgi:hypothetical protein